MEGIYRFQYEGYYGSLSGIFIATQEEAMAIQGKYIYFGEVLGGYSEVIVMIDNNNFKHITNDTEMVTLFKQYNLTTGYNPFDYC